MSTPSNVLFGTDATQQNLLTVNMLTGAGTIVGNMGTGLPVPALSIDPTTGIMYAGTGRGVPNLYTVDATTGAATLVGNTGLGFSSISDLAFRNDGTLFAAVNINGDGGTGGDHLAIIDKITAVATVIGPFGTCIGNSCTIEGIEGIAFDSSGTLWGSHSVRGPAGPPGLYTINTVTGSATFVTPIVNTDGSTPSGGVVGLKFACDGTLFGGTARAISPATDGGFLITIDPATGHWSFVGAVSATGGTSLAALALLCPQVPCSECESILIDRDCRLNLGLDAPNGPNNPIPACVCHDICVEEVRLISALPVINQCIAFPGVSQCRLGGFKFPRLKGTDHCDIFVICAQEDITEDCTAITVKIGILIVCFTDTTPPTPVPFVTTITKKFPGTSFFPFPDCTTSLSLAQFQEALEIIDGSCTIIQLNATTNTAGDQILINGKIIEKLWKHEDLWVVGLRPFDLSPNDVAINGFVSFTISQELQPINTCASFPCPF